MTTKTPTTAYRLTNLDTGKSRYFATLERAFEVGNKALGLPANGPGFWKETLAGFSAESQTGWQRNNGAMYLTLIPIEIEG